jgi:hypothetical protein
MRWLLESAPPKNCKNEWEQRVANISQSETTQLKQKVSHVMVSMENIVADPYGWLIPNLRIPDSSAIHKSAGF